MTKRELEQLIDLKKEVRELEEKIKSEETEHLRNKLKERKHKASVLEAVITEYINTVTDSRIRRIMQYKYIEGYTWKKIADIMHYDRSYPEKAVSRYLNKVDKSI